MDKTDLIAKTARDPEDRLLLARVLDKYEQMERRSAPTATGFLSPREQKLAEAVLHAAGVRSGYAFDGGWQTVKLYFMIGLPYETDEDVAGIARLAEKVVELYYASDKTNKRRAPSVNISVAGFVPKPFTPFQWAGQNDMETLSRKQKLLKAEIRNRHIKYSYHQSDISVLEGIFARGDRKLNRVLVRAFELGCKLDGWSECFDMDRWRRAFADCGIEPDFYTRERSYDELFPWDFVDIGVTKDFMMRENERAKAAVTTPHCRLQCSACGAADLCAGGRCSVYKEESSLNKIKELKENG